MADGCGRKSEFSQVIVGSSTAVILCPSGQVINIFQGRGKFFQLKESLNSLSSNPRSYSNHRLTVYYICRGLVNIQAFGSLQMAASKHAHRLTTEIDQLSTGQSGDLDKSADGRPSTIFRLSPIGRYAPATRTVPCSRIFLISKLKQFRENE